MPITEFILLLALQTTALVMDGTRLSSAGKPLPLTSIGLESDLDADLDPDDPGTGGGFETTAYFRTRLTEPAKVVACTDGLEAAAASWAASKQMARRFRERGDSMLTVQYVRSGLAGFFQLKYRLEAARRARVRVDFYRLDGDPVDPATIPAFLSAYSIAALQDSLDRAIQCGGGS